MGYFDNNQKYINYFRAAISLDYPNILSFINYSNILLHNESLFNSSNDYYIYKSISTDLPDDNIFKQKWDVFKKGMINSRINDDDALIDLVATPYLPFISNCEYSGSHITLNDLFLHPNCSLKNKSVSLFI